MTDKIENSTKVSIPMERSKLTEIKNKIDYIQDLLDSFQDAVREAELTDNINRKVEVSESARLVGTAVTDVDEYERYAIENCKETTACQAWMPVICVIGIAGLLISLIFLAA